MADELGVSLRTIYRDIHTLVNQGAPIDAGSGVGFLLRPGFLLPPLMFTGGEIEALMLGARWVSHQSDPALATAAQDVVAKITAVLPLRLREALEVSPLFPVPAAGVAADTVDATILRDALRLERKLRIAYRDEGQADTIRVVWPIAIAFYERVRVLVAWCELRRDFRHFRTD